MKLVVVSHTSHQMKDGRVYGFGSTVREINYLASIFETVCHIAPLQLGPIDSSSKLYEKNVEFIPIKQVGGSRLGHKIKILLNAADTIKVVHNELKGADFFQLRTPTAIGLYLIPYFLLSKKAGWFKYAGNWVDKSKPLSYSIQKLMLQLQRRKKVTINGHWPGQRSNILSFENPCLTDQELQFGMEVSSNKKFDEGLTLLFVGRVDHLKGIDKLIAMVNLINNTRDIAEVIIVGDGEIDFYKKQNMSAIKVTFTGGLTREEINPYYERAHILILPSQSEGFPKVVAEAAAFGCVPVVTNISSLSQYIDSTNGLLFSSFDSSCMAKELQELVSNRSDLKRKAVEVTKLASRFTYAHYLNRVQKELLL